MLRIKQVFLLIIRIIANPKKFLTWTKFFGQKLRSDEFLRNYERLNVTADISSENKKMDNPLWDYFQGNNERNGIFKWEHYFDVYHNYLKKFIEKEVKILEIGMYSGGSLGMWKSYLGAECKVYGIDIKEDCKQYENEHTTVFIGDQADRSFWRSLFHQIGPVDIIIDDGGHSVDQQRVTFEESLPFLNPGGIYLCEDIHGVGNRFAEYCTNLVHDLNFFNSPDSDILESEVSNFQSTVKGMHFFPYLFVLEKHENLIKSLRATKIGSNWRPL